MANNVQFESVLLGGDANVYGMARSFFEEYGVVSHCIGKGAFHICQHSKFLTLDVAEPNIEDDAVFVDTLLAFAKNQKQQTGNNANNNADNNTYNNTYNNTDNNTDNSTDNNAGNNADKSLVLVPCGDNYTKLLVRNQDALRDTYKFSIMSPEQFEMLSTKDRFYKTCERYGLVFPKTDEVTKANASEYEPPFDYPVMVKPANSPMYWNCEYEGKKKAFIARNSEELHEILRRVYSSTYTDTMIVQDFVPGDDSRMRVVNCYSNQAGHVSMMTLGDVVLEEHAPEGIGSYGAIMTGFGDADTNILQNIKAFLEEIAFVGYSNFDLKYDERDNTYKLFELNPRQGRSSYFTTASGMNLARYLINDILLGQDDPCETPSAEDEVLWTMIPLDVIRKYTTEPDVLVRIDRLVDQGKVVHSYWSPDDKSFLRWIGYKANQRNYRQMYAKYFNRRHIDD